MKLNISISSKFNPDRFVWHKLKTDVDLNKTDQAEKGEIIGLLDRVITFFAVRKTDTSTLIPIDHSIHRWIGNNKVSNIVDFETGKKLAKEQIKQVYARVSEFYLKEKQ